MREKSVEMYSLGLDDYRPINGIRFSYYDLPKSILVRCSRKPFILQFDTRADYLAFITAMGLIKSSENKKVLADEFRIYALRFVSEMNPTSPDEREAMYRLFHFGKFAEDVNCYRNCSFIPISESRYRSLSNSWLD